MTETTFTEAEEAFIAVSVEVFAASVALDEAEKAFEEVEQKAIPIADALDLPDNAREAVDRTHELTLEAARRGGYDEDSPVVDGLNKTHAMMHAYLDEIDAAAVEALSNGANPEF